MGFALRCPDCREKFPWDATKKFPRYCPICKVDQGEERADDDVVMPFLRSQKTTNNDAHYREHEAASERRAEAAAEMAGVPTSEMSGLKITNLNDRRDAEIMAMPVVNEVTKLMDTGIGGFQGANGAEWSGAVKQGPYPNQGARTLGNIQRKAMGI